MKVWKVILVTLVIFGTGVVTGTLLSKRTLPIRPLDDNKPSVSGRSEEGPRPPDQNRRRSFLSRIQKELDLTPDQSSRIEQILNAGQVRTQALWDEITPRMKEEFHATREQIREVLTPEQEEEFEKLFPKNKHSKPKKSEDDSACRLDDHPMALPFDVLLDQSCDVQCDAFKAEPST